MTDKYIHTLAAFSATDLIGYNRFIKIKKNFPDISDFLDCDTSFQMDFLGLKTEKVIPILKNMKQQGSKILDICLAKNIDLIPHSHTNYPPTLKKILDPPYLLYSQGNIQPSIPMIAVIGTRNHTTDAEKINRWFCKEFTKYGLGIVSGLAQGHDIIAAETVLKYEGYSIGVLGTAIDNYYPKSSLHTIYQLKEQGCIISEYPPGMISTKWRFPRRNRIVSGIAQAVLVVQAPEKSGTMITVNMATDQGKDVYVIPGNPMIPQNHGTNLLLQKGAKVALQPQDIIQDILKSNPNLETMQFLHENIDDSQTSHNTQQEKSSLLKSLSSEELRIFELAEKPIHIDEIARELGINISHITSILTMMELKEIIIQKPGHLYVQGEIL